VRDEKISRFLKLRNNAHTRQAKRILKKTGKGANTFKIANIELS